MVNLNNVCVTDSFQFSNDYPIALNQPKTISHY